MYFQDKIVCVCGHECQYRINQCYWLAKEYVMQMICNICNRYGEIVLPKKIKKPY